MCALFIHQNIRRHALREATRTTVVRRFGLRKHTQPAAIGLIRALAQARR